MDTDQLPAFSVRFIEAIPRARRGLTVGDVNGQRNPKLSLQKKKQGNEGFGVSDPGQWDGIHIFLARISSNYLELPRISQKGKNRSDARTIQITSEIRIKSGVPSGMLETNRHNVTFFRKWLHRKKMGFGNNRHINRHVSDREPSQEGGRVQAGESRDLISGARAHPPTPGVEKRLGG
jgi:hypothetical protein